VRCFSATSENKKFTWCFPFVSIATSTDRTEQSLSAGMFLLCTDESFRITVRAAAKSELKVNYEKV